MPTATKVTGSQFDGLLSPRKRHNVTPGILASEQETNPKRRPGLAKSKDPDFRSATLYLRKKTLAECEYRLKSTEDDRDMSELVEDLMTGWLARAHG